MKVLLIDDHPLILSALQGVIRGIGDDVSVVGVEGAVTARAELTRDENYDLVLLDLSLEDADGFELLHELRANYPAIPVVVVSATERASDVIRSIDAGAMGFVPKRSSGTSLADALQTVMAGGIYLPEPMLALMQTSRSVHGESDTTPGAMQMNAHAAPGTHQKVGSLEKLALTPRQTEVLALLLQGKPNKLIARELNLSVETVKDHVAAVLRALNVSSRTQAVLAVGQMQREQGAFAAWKPNPRG
jgi:DNA-binding NarL/FixJ family response regulator